MFSFIRGRLTYANAAVTAALVFAMAGGAFAATGGGHAATTHKKARTSGYVITTTKQIKPQVLTQLKGNAGLEGKQGATGSEGKPGAAGKDGTNGADGTAGQSVKPAPFTGAKGSCTDGGVEFTVGTGSPTYACNGANGTAGQSVSSAEFSGEKGACKYGGAEFTIGTSAPSYVCNGKSAGEALASSATETGSWSVTISGTKVKVGEVERYLGTTTIGYHLPLPEGETPKVHYVTTEQVAEKEVPECPEQGEALPGNLCLYEVATYGVGSEFKFAGQISPTTAGTTALFFNLASEGPTGLVIGNWALTAE